ncbi:hypothetical protein AWENTII_009863 [Aspergillus wentii]
MEVDISKQASDHQKLGLHTLGHLIQPSAGPTDQWKTGAKILHTTHTKREQFETRAAVCKPSTSPDPFRPSSPNSPFTSIRHVT